MKYLVVLLVALALFACGSGGDEDQDRFQECETGNGVSFGENDRSGVFCFDAYSIGQNPDGEYWCRWHCVQDNHSDNPEECQSLMVTFTSGKSNYEFGPCS